ncbi:MAG TPA: hypothetical protein VHT21_05965, partial [Stellaceae bacterium]|nr:hypothetical protein [Stellaceae bacterium]
MAIAEANRLEGGEVSARRELSPPTVEDRPELSGPFTLTEWVLPQDMELFEWTERGIELSRHFNAKNWWLADWWNAGPWTRGERKRVIKDLRWKGPAYSACANIGFVGKVFDSSRRRESLT